MMCLVTLECSPKEAECGCAECRPERYPQNIKLLLAFLDDRFGEFGKCEFCGQDELGCLCFAVAYPELDAPTTTMSRGQFIAELKATPRTWEKLDNLFILSKSPIKGYDGPILAVGRRKLGHHFVETYSIVQVGISLGLPYEEIFTIQRTAENTHHSISSFADVFDAVLREQMLEACDLPLDQ